MTVEETPKYLRGVDEQGRHHRLACRADDDLVSRIRAMDDEQPGTDDGLMWFVASTDHFDRYDTIIEQDWLENGRMADFARNPVAVFIHDYKKLPVGRVEKWRVVDLEDGHRALVLGIAWDEKCQYGSEVARKYRERFLFAVSVGFDDPEEVVPLRSLPEGDPRRRERGWLLRGNSLWEVSPVPVPGNAMAGKREQPGMSDLIRESAPDEWRSMVGDYLRSDEGRALLAEAMGEREAEPKRDPLASMFGIPD